MAWQLYAMREDAAVQEAFLAEGGQKSALPKMITQVTLHPRFSHPALQEMRNFNPLAGVRRAGHDLPQPHANFAPKVPNIMSHNLFIHEFQKTDSFPKLSIQYFDK
jgi:hypothetical protein